MIIDKDKKTVQFTRRRLLQGAGITGAALATSTGLGSLTGLMLPGEANAADPFWKGCDVSWVPQMEATGYKFYTAAGVQDDILSILKSYGCNAVRLRTWVNPSSDPANGHCSDVETAAMALRCKNAGLAVMIDLHYGDIWNSVGQQNPPAAWSAYNYTQMQSAIYNYTYHTMNVIKSNGVTPKWVQVGNEINIGVCRPVGAVSIPAQMTGLLNAGYDMVKQVFPSCSVITHLAQPQNGTAITNMLTPFFANGGKTDILGFSSYGDYTVAAAIVGNMKSFSTQYGKPFMQVEFGGATTNPGKVAQSTTAYIQAVRNNGGLGLFYFEPEGYSPFTSYNLTAWQNNGQPYTAIMNAFLAA